MAANPRRSTLAQVLAANAPNSQGAPQPQVMHEKKSLGELLRSSEADRSTGRGTGRAPLSEFVVANGPPLGASAHSAPTPKEHRPSERVSSRHSAMPYRQQPQWVEGSFKTVSSDMSKLPPSSYMGVGVNRAENKTLRPTSNALFGLPQSAALGYTTTQQDLCRHQPEHYAQRAANLVSAPRFI